MRVRTFFLRTTWVAAAVCVQVQVRVQVVQSFSIPPQKHVKDSPTSTPQKESPLSSASSMFEYEYIPPNQGGSHDFQTTLPSVYPDDTPAGMRGEAVRAALRSTQCLGWKLATKDTDCDSPNLSSGLLKLQGRGALDFLNNKLSNSFLLPATGSGESKNDCFAQACLLTSKGRLVDTLAIGYADTQAYVMPSPGHSGAALFQKLDPFIFPMDQVKLTDLSESSCIFTLASTHLQHVQDAIEKQLLPKLQEILPTAIGLDHNKKLVLPAKEQSLVVNLSSSEESKEDACLVVIPHAGLPDCAVVGYTLAFYGSAQAAGNQVWQHLVGDDNPRGPVEIKALEYESLRIETGQPGFGFEVTGAWKEPEITAPTPLELHQKAGVIDLEKGCYLGQEGIASILKNPRGPPRSLYTVTFEDDDNTYLHQSEGDNSRTENLTKLPKVGDKLFALGSNEQIQVGTLTSVAEPYSTGDTTIVGLALIRRTDSILRQMKAKDLQIPRGIANKLTPVPAIDDSSSSGIIPPPPMDSLDGLEVIVGGTFTVGMLRGVPSRRLPKGNNMYVDQEQAFLTKNDILDEGYVNIAFSGMSPAEFMDEKAAELDESPDEKIDADEGETEDAIDEEQVESTASNEGKQKDAADEEAEAKRKTAKMELLKQRAEEAMARRKQKRLEAGNEKASAKAAAEGDASGEEDQEAAEARRKAEKMGMLKKRTEEAIARRKRKRNATQD